MPPPHGCAPVPAGYCGVWRRTLLLTAEHGVAVADTTTEVRWLQTASCFGDVRVPRDAPPSAGEEAHAHAHAPLEERDAGALRALTTRLGFAGHTDVRGDICQWHREARWRASLPRGHARPRASLCARAGCARRR
jgi:hypothetical protein